MNLNSICQPGSVMCGRKVDAADLNTESTNADSSSDNHHTEEIQSLFQSKEILFPVWYFQLAQGFNLMFHGYGSKKMILKKFCESPIVLHNYKVLFVDGTSVELTLERLISKIHQEYLFDYIGTYYKKYTKASDKRSATSDEICKLMEKRRSKHQFIDGPPKPLLLAILNIDGYDSSSSCAVRDGEFQSFLFNLTLNVPEIKMIATFDHVNSAFLFSNKWMLSGSFIFHDVTTFLHYRDELRSVELSVKGKISSDGHKQTCALTVLGNLTFHARKIYSLLLQVQYKWTSMEEYLSQRASNGENSQSRSNLGTPKNMSKIASYSLSNLEDSPSLNSLALKLLASPASKSASTPSSALSGKLDYLYFPGMTFSQYYNLAVENFLTSSEMTFRTTLGEFFDHKILSSKTPEDGEDLLFAPFRAAAILQIANGLSEMDK